MRSWLPRDERARADATRWQAWAIAHWQPALQVFVFQNLFKRLSGLGDPDPVLIEQAGPRVARFAAILEAALAKREWLCGGDLTVADLTVAAYLVYAEPAAIPLGDYPNVLSWWSRLRQRPAWAVVEARIPVAQLRVQ